MKIAAMGIVIKDNQVLLVNRKWHPKLWSPPGGFVDAGETEEQAVYREVWEETGVICQVIGKVHELVYENSHVVIYACSYLSGELQCSFESFEVRWFEIDRLPSPLSPDITVFENALRTIQDIANP